MTDNEEPRLSTASRLSMLYQTVYRRVGRDSGFALFDQVIVSGTRFVTAVLIGRICGAEQLGEFALAFQLSVLVTVAQETLISTPYTIFGNRREGAERSEYAGSVLVHSFVLSAIAVACFALTALLLSSGPDKNDFAQSIWILAAVIPVIVLREFGRRFAFAHLRMSTAVAIDLAMAATQIGGLIVLAITDSLSAAAALWVMGLAAAVSGVGWLIHDYRRFTFRFTSVMPAWKKNWSFGRWLFGGSMVSAATDASLYWVLALVSGLSTTGIFAACMAIVQLANPILLGLSNFLEPLTARAFAQGGSVKVRNLVRKGQMSLAAILILFCIAVAVVGADFVALVYHGAEYAGHDHTVIILALSVLATALGLSPSFGLRVFEKSHLIFQSKVLESAVIFAVIIAFAKTYGTLAAAYALLLGGVAVALMLSFTFFREASLQVVSIVETQT